MPSTSRRLRSMLLAGALALGGASACGGMDTPQRRAAPPPESAPAENPFLPEDRNVGDCVSSLPRPDCGSDARGGAGQAITFGVLMVGMALIGWRIAHAVRRRDRAAAEAPAEDPLTT